MESYPGKLKRWIWLLAMILLGGTMLWLGAGCTSDLPNSVGSSLNNRDFDVVLSPLAADTTVGFSSLAIEDPDIPLNNQEVLYLGEDGGTASSILVNFNFDDLFSEDFPESLFTDENIQTVKLSLTKLRFYGTAAADSVDTLGIGSEGDIFYSFKLLDAPFDSTTFPGPVPEHSGLQLVQGPLDEVYGNEPLIPLFKQDFLQWMQEGGTKGFLIETALASEPGLVGFASRELDSFGELEDVAVGTVVAPNLVINFVNEETNFLLPPVADISTFHEIEPIPADLDDGFVVRTGLRSYPVFRFDFSGLPQDAFINRAVLFLSNDLELSFGALHSLVISELPVDIYQEPTDSLTLADLAAAAFVITGQTSLDPKLNEDLRFDVTQAVQRMANHVYEGERGLVITAGEDFAPLYDQGSIDPEFYYSLFHFHGFGAADSLRPRLEITYSLSEDISGGGK